MGVFSLGLQAQGDIEEGQEYGQLMSSDVLMIWVHINEQ